MVASPHEHPFPNNQLQYVSSFEPYAPPAEGDDPRPSVRTNVEELDKANVIISREVGFRTHRPVLDLDIEAKLVPSSTPGHFHLYLDKSMSWEDYCELLYVLAKVGIIEPGYASVSMARGYTAVRLPWIKK